jgi:hypothetical protein
LLKAATRRLPQNELRYLIEPILRFAFQEIKISRSTTRTSRNQTGFYPSSFFSKINAQRIDEDQRIKTNNGKMIKGKIIGGARRVF